MPHAPPDPLLPRRLLAGWNARDVAPVASLMVLTVFFSCAADGFLRWGTITNVLVGGMRAVEMLSGEQLPRIC